MHIQKLLAVLLITLAVLGLTACNRGSEPEIGACETSPAEIAASMPPATTPEPSPFILTASIQDLMLSIVDPSADSLWESVSTISNQDGITQNQPRTDAEWEELRHKALALMEATNLLSMQGRRVVEEGKHLADEGVEGNLTAAQIQKLIDDDHATFQAFAHALHDTTLKALKTIDTRDVDAFFDAGGDIDTACEACHVKYWYPNQGIPYGN